MLYLIVALGEDVGGDDGLLVHNGLHNLGDVGGGDGLVNWHGVWLVDGDGVGLVNGHGLGDWDGLWHTDQLDGLHGHGREVSAKTESVTTETSGGGDRHWGGVADWASAQQGTTVTTVQTAKTAKTAIGAEEGRVGNSHREEGSDNEEFHFGCGWGGDDLGSDKRNTLRC